MKRFLASWPRWARWNFYATLAIYPVFLIWLISMESYFGVAYLILILPVPWFFARRWNRTHPEPGASNSN
jgi:hypothetical protein